MIQMTLKSLAAEVGKPPYSVRYALRTHDLCKDVQWVGNIRLFSEEHVAEMKAHFANVGPHNAGRPKKDKTEEAEQPKQYEFREAPTGPRSLTER